MRIVVPGLLAGLLVAVGCSADEGAQPEVAVLVPTTQEGYVDEWRTANWPRAADRDETAQADPSAPRGDDSTQPQEQADSTSPGSDDVGPPDTLAFDDDPVDDTPGDDSAADDSGADSEPDNEPAAVWPCDSVSDMREVLQWANATFSEGSKGSLEEMPDNFRAAVAAAQGRDSELRAAVASSAQARPDLAADFETLEDRHLWIMGELEQVGNEANDAYEINSMGFEVFDSPAGVEWAARVDYAKTNIDNQLVPECGVAFDDPVN